MWYIRLTQVLTSSLGLSLPLCPRSAQQPSVPSVLDSPCHYVAGQPSSLQFPLSWTLLATMLQVSPAAFSSLCLGLSLPLYPRSAQQPSVPSVLDSPCHYAPGQPSSLQFPLSWTLLATLPQISPAAFSSLCLGLSLPLYPRSAQQPSVPSVLDSPCHYAPGQPSSLQFPLSWTLLAAVPHVSQAATSSLCLELSLPLCPRSAQQPSIPSVLGSPCQCTACQPSSHQFPLPWALLAAVPHVSPAASSSLCLGLSLLLCPMSAKQPPVPSALGSPCCCAPCQPSNHQFPLPWALLVAVPHVSQAATSSLCLGLSLLLCPMSAKQPPVPSALGSPCCCLQPSVPLRWFVSMRFLACPYFLFPKVQVNAVFAGSLSKRTLQIQWCKRLNTGQFPDKLKVAKVIPIFKKNDPTLFTNYRPISILPVISKVLERIMNNQLLMYFTNTKLLSDNQYGFRPHHSTEYAALEIVDRITTHLDNNQLPISIYKN